MSDQTTALKISADASGVEAGVSTAKRSLATLGAAAKSVGETVGKGMAPIGDGADGAAKKVDNATKSIISSIQRTTALMEAGERGSAKYYEALGAQRGISVDALKPYIAQLEAVKEKQAQAAAALAGGSVSLGKVEMSARATSAALRGVPAQFTDIITSLQGGQAPMTVLLQQGGQLKDMFGGAGNAAKALGGYVIGLINPFTIAAATVGVLAIAYSKGADEARAFQNAATLTGGAVGVSNTQFALMAQSISSIAGTRGKASEVLTEIASTGKLAGSGIKGIAEAAILMEKATGQAVSKTVAEFVKLSDEPAKASIELNKQYHYLTTSVYEQIKALEDQGKKTQAAELAEKSYADALKTRALSVVDNAGLMEKAWRGITGAAKGAWDAMLNVGRPTSEADQIGALEKQLRDRQSRNASLGIKDGAATQQIIDQIAALKEVVRLEQRSTEATAERAKIQAAGTAAVDAVAKANERAASKQEQLNKALREYRDNIAAIRSANPQSALLDPKTIAAAEAGIRDQFKDAKGPAAKPDAYLTDVARAYTKALEDLDKVQISASASADKLSKTQEILRGVQASPEWASFSRRKQEEVIMAASLAQAEEDRRAALDSAKKAQDAYNASARESANSIANKLEALGDETRAYAIATEKNISLAEAIDLVAIARLEDEVIRAKIADNYTGVKDLEREIELRKELAKELRNKADNTAMVESSKAAAAATSAEFKRGWEETDRLGRQVWTDMTTQGENAAEKVGKAFRTTVSSALYDVFAKPFLLQVYTSIVGGAGGVASTATQAASGASSASSGLNILGSAGTLFGSGFKAGLGAVFGEAGTMGGFSAGTTAIGAGNLAGGFGTLAGTALPWIAGAAVLKSLTDYKIDAKGSGITATVGGASGLPSGKVGTYAEFQQTGGLGGGGVTTNRDWGVADQGVADYIAGNVKAITASNKAYGDALGLTSDKIETFTKNLEINTTGLDAAGQKAAIDKELAKFSSEQIAATYGDALASVAKTGETTSDTLARLSTDITGVNAVFDALGYKLYDVSVAGAAAASGLASAFGSLAAMQSQTAALYNNYYTQAEKKAYTVNSAAATLNAAGITDFTAADISGATREQVRAVVDQYAAKIGTADGDKKYAAVVAAANSLNSVVPAFQAAADAPASVVSAGGSGGGGGGGGSSSSAAADEISSAWKSITESIWGEVKRIRGLIEGTGEDAFAAAQTRFSIATAQARAGDQEAAKALPELSQNLLTLGETNAQTLLQLRLLQGQTAASLTTTGSILSAGFGLTVPSSVGVGTIPTPQASAQVYTPAYNPVLSGGGGAGNDSATAAALRALADRLDLIEANTRAGAQHGGALSRQITRLVPDGDALEVRLV